MFNTQIQGIDISAWQTYIDWQKVKTIPNLRFVFVKATQGVSYTSPRFQEQHDGSISAGKDTGCTHFLDTQNYIIGNEVAFGRAQADHFHEVTKSRAGISRAGFLVDFETNEGAAWEAITALNVDRFLKIDLAFHLRMMELGRGFGGDYILPWIAEHMQEFTQGWGFLPRYKVVRKVDAAGNPVLDANGKEIWYQPEINHLITDAELATYPKPGFGAFSEVTVFQYCSTLKGEVVGFVGGHIDADIFNGDEAKYQAWLTRISGISGGTIPTMTIPTMNPAALFQAKCIRTEGVDTRNEFNVDIKMDLHNGDYVDVFKIGDAGTPVAGMWLIDQTIPRWVTSSPNYMVVTFTPPVVTPPDTTIADLKARIETLELLAGQVANMNGQIQSLELLVAGMKVNQDKQTAWMAGNVKGF